MQKPPRTAKGQIEVMQQLSQKATAWLLDLDRTAMWGSRSDCPRNEDDSYDASAVMKWRLSQNQSMGTDSLMDGNDSPALERYRAAKAIEAERKNDLQAGKLINSEDLRRILMDLSKRFLEQAQSMERTHGPDIGEQIREMVGVVVDKWRELIGDSGE